MGDGSFPYLFTHLLKSVLHKYTHICVVYKYTYVLKNSRQVTLPNLRLVKFFPDVGRGSITEGLR